MISTPEYSRRLGRRFILAVVLLGATAPSEAETGALLTEAKAALRAGDGIAAQARLREALRDGASPDAVRALMGEALLDQGDRVSARKWLAAARFTRETRGLGYRMLGRLEQADGNLPAAGKAYDRALESDPSDPALWSDIARLRFAGGELKGAIDAADHAVSIGQNSAPALTMRAVLVREQFGLRSSLPWFRAALSRAPNDPDLLAEYAATLGDMGRAREMLEVARRLVAVSPGDPRGFLLQAALAARAGNNRLARTLLDRTGGSFTDLPAAMLLEGVLALREGDYSVAVAQLDRLGRLRPDDPIVQALLARALAAGAGRAVPSTVRPVGHASVWSVLGAEEGLQTAALRHADAPTDAQACARYVRALLRAGDNAAAAKVAAQLVQARPGLPDAHLMAGDVALASGDRPAALRAYQQGARLSLGREEAQRLAVVLRELGRDAEAVAVSRRFARENPLAT